MKSKFIGVLIASLFALIVTVGMPSAANAQIGQLRYQTRYSKAQVGDIIRRLESSSNTFRQDFDKALDHSRINGTSAEDRYNQYVKDYSSSLVTLRRQFDRNSSWWLVRDDVSNTISRASAVNDIINNLSFRRNIERQWSAMRNDLNTLADTFDLPGLNGGGWTGGPWNGGNQGGWNGTGNMSSPPSWAQGTFYGTAPDGSQIMLIIDREGRVTAQIGSSRNFGTYYRGSLYLNGAQSRISQWGNGIRTTRNDNGETITYNRNSWGENQGGGWNGQTSSPPSWAQGTFYGTGPDGSRIVLTISANGNVTASVNGSNSYGGYNRGILTINGASSRVTRWGNGITTTRTDNGEVINYSVNNWGGGGGNWGGGGVGSPINWAIGSFNARNPQTGGVIYLTINGNGQVTANIDGNMTYGTLNGTTLTINGVTSTVSRNGNGIRTTRNDNGERINYRRN